MKSKTCQAGLLLPLLLLLTWLLSACSPAFYAKFQQPLTSHSCELLSYHEELRTMSAKELTHELTALRLTVNDAETRCEQLRLAMLLGMPEFRFDHDTEAEQLLVDFFNQEQPSAIRDVQMAQLLMDEIHWRKQIECDQQALEQQLNEERASSTELLEQLKSAQSKLNQLKNIDKNINAREREISAPSTDKIPHESK